MNYHRLSLVLLIFIMVAGIASSSYSDISNAAVLFLRIAPGSRAAGMGEAFVAVADDATTTHWNPAGLGTYPLAQTWLNAGIPDQYRPLIGVTAVKTGRGPNYLAFDIWAINKSGLVRYDNKDWQTSEVFHTKTDETVEMKVRDYFSVTDDARMSRIIDRVAAANNRGTYDELVVLRDDVISLVPEDYDDLAALEAGFDTLLASYELCLLKWDQIARVRDYVKDGLADSVFTTDEIDRINFALEKSIGRFIPEDLTIAYSDILTGEPTAITSDGEILLVGTTDGLLQYNGVKWSRNDIESGLPSNRITYLYNVGSSTVIGTDRGVALHNGLVVAAVDTASVLIEGPVEALGGTNSQDIYAVVG